MAKVSLRRQVYEIIEPGIKRKKPGVPGRVFGPAIPQRNRNGT
jgi:hypothetical protein